MNSVNITLPATEASVKIFFLVKNALKEIQNGAEFHSFMIIQIYYTCL